jgi:Iap family predicted aminopeptidase
MSELSSIIPTISGIVGVLIGASIGPLINHQLTTRYSKKDLIFKRKLDYFEKVLETIEKNTKLYKQQVRKLEVSHDSKEIKKIVEEMKKERKHFFIMSSPLYFDVTKISGRIIRFVKIEKDIFSRISKLEKINEKEKEVLVEQLKRMLMILEKRGSEILFEMKKELRKY